MTSPVTTPLRQRAAWTKLEAHHAEIAATTIAGLFAADPDRGDQLNAEACGIFVDYSKNRINEQTLTLLRQLAEESGLRERIDAMFRGDRINITEDRAVLHVALRAPKREKIRVDGVDVVPAVHEVLGRMGEFANRVREGEWRGYTGQRITAIVNV